MRNLSRWLTRRRGDVKASLSRCHPRCGARRSGMAPSLRRQKATAAPIATIHHQRMRTMQPAITGHEAVHRDEHLLVHNWRVARLTRLGIPGPLAEVHADRLDWHKIARLVQRGFRTAPSSSSAPATTALARTRACRMHGDHLQRLSSRPSNATPTMVSARSPGPPPPDARCLWRATCSTEVAPHGRLGRVAACGLPIAMSWPSDCRDCGSWSTLALWPSSWRSLIAMTLDHRPSSCPAPCGLIVSIL
jgi:hypothetical protein